MKVSEVIKFRSDLFFDGAVQLLWADQNEPRASQAARTFVFHGPKYHGVSKDSQVDEAYRLTDTATLIADLLFRIAQGGSASASPFSLAIAGYGSGKSHFAIALTKLLRDHQSDVAKAIVANLSSADSNAAKIVAGALVEMGRPALVVALDGTGNFNLGNALSSALFQSLRDSKIDDAPLRELSPRFDDAVNFVKRNYAVRSAEFTSKCGARSEDNLIGELSARNEDIYSLVDEIYLHANGAHIPVEGRESAQDLISTFCEVYCGKSGPFSRLVIIFDEFGRFLEYVAERPALAGDSALQQIFQGIQDNSERAHFVGFIQYELKAYLARLGQRDAMHIQKYITRFDVSKKYYLSSNLETIIAHLLEKADTKFVNGALSKRAAELHELHRMMGALLPGFEKIPVWKDYAEFERVIVQGCWPLHPLATWFLTRQQDIVQSRSAITFVKNALDRVANREVTKSIAFPVPASHVVESEMLNEMLAAERAHGGSAVDNLIATLSKYEAQLGEPERHLLVAVTAAKKMRVVSSDRAEYDRLLSAFAGLDVETCQPLLSRLELDLGVLAWSDELKQYELITDAATRGQYQKDLRKKTAGVPPKEVGEVFVGRAKAWTDDLFQDIATPFGQKRDIPTLEWTFASHLANDQSLLPEIQNAFVDWRQASKPDQAKGQVIFAYLDPESNILAIEEKIARSVKAELKKSNTLQAPIWVVLLADLAGRIRDYLTTLYVLEDGFEAKDKDRYSRFIPEARQNAIQGLRSVLRDAIQNRTSVYAGVAIKPSRLTSDATSIFEQVYSKALPFPFDGFGSKGGNGGASAAIVARALFGREVSGAWLDVQDVKVQNRVRALLDRSWGVLDPQGKVKAVAGNADLKELLDQLEKLHKKVPKTSLGDDLQTLLQPPYGLNLSSAAILLGLFVGKTTPPRAIHYENNGISLQEWLKVAFGTKGKFLDEAVLTRTTIAFLTEDALSRWQLVLQNWDAETTLEGILHRRDDAMEQRQKDPIPESLETQFNYLRDRAQTAETELSAHQALLEECETRLEHALKRQGVGEIFAVADRLTRKNADMKNAKTKWSDDQMTEVSDAIAQIRDIAVTATPDWIRVQTCNSQQQVMDFRTKMERAERTLGSLGLRDLANAVHTHAGSMIASVEQRFRYKMAIDEATDLNRLPEPVTSSRIREVRDTIESAARIIAVLDMAKSELGATADLTSLLGSLKDRQVRLRNFIASRQAEIERYCDMKPGSTEDMNDLIAHLSGLKHQFAATPDAADLERRSICAVELKANFSQLDDINGEPENLSSSLKTAIASLPFLVEGIASGEQEEEERLDVTWMTGCLNSYVENRIAAAKSRSELWAKMALQELAALSADIPRLLQHDSLDQYAVTPGFLSKKDRETVNKKLLTVRGLKDKGTEDLRLEKAQKWLAGLIAEAKELGSLSREVCNHLLEKISKRPDFVGETEFKQLGALRAKIEGRLDELDFSDLIKRIASLTEKARKALFNELAESYGIKVVS